MRIIAWAGIAALLIDQIAKYRVVHVMELARRRAIDVYPPYLNFRYGENRGINFGLLSGETTWMRWVLIGFSLLVCGAVLTWLWRLRPGWPMQISAGLLIGGALGNVLDRLLLRICAGFPQHVLLRDRTIPSCSTLPTCSFSSAPSGLSCSRRGTGRKTPRDLTARMR